MTDDDALREALANCDREPIHIPGAIQSFGVLLAGPLDLSTIAIASSNAATLLGVDAEELLGSPFASCLTREVVHRARNALSRASSSTQREVVGELDVLESSATISVHAHGGRAIVELLPRPSTSRRGLSDTARQLFAESMGGADLRTVLNAAVQRLREITRYDRVLAYRFLPDGSGEVVAEARADAMPSFLGLRYPASDIPQQARALYARTPLRIIADVRSEPVALVSRDPDAEPLDLSLSVLRASSPVHLRYLDNMDVRASMSLPLVVGGALWGLFALHHAEPRDPDPDVLATGELAGRALSLVVEHTQLVSQETRLRRCLALAAQLADEPALVTHPESARALFAAIAARGLFLARGDRVFKAGQVPSDEVCLTVRELSSREGPTGLDDLSARLPDTALEGAAGALLVPLAEAPKTDLVFLRGEVAREITWAGGPDKQITRGEHGYQLHPRASFARYVEAVGGRSDEWTSDDLDAAARIQAALVDAISLRRSLARGADLGVAELRHRLGNVFSLVRALVVRTAPGPEGLGELEQRLSALADAHRAADGTADLRDLLHRQLAPFVPPEPAALDVEGPDVVLNAPAAPLVALLVRELTSNAVKHGALSTAQGRLTVRWDWDSEGLVVRWEESGGPRVTPPHRQGFGLTLLEQALPYEIGGRAHLDFDPSGLRATFWLPSELVSRAEGSASSAPRARTVAQGRALVVEDHFLLAEQLTSELRDLGFEEVDVASTATNALTLLEARDYAFCLLDLELGGSSGRPVGLRALALGVPLVVVSGYDVGDGPARLDAPHLVKPIDQAALQGALDRVRDWTH